MGILFSRAGESLCQIYPPITERPHSFSITIKKPKSSGMFLFFFFFLVCFYKNVVIEHFAIFYVCHKMSLRNPAVQVSVQTLKHYSREAPTSELLHFSKGTHARFPSHGSFPIATICLMLPLCQIVSSAVDIISYDPYDIIL